MLKFDYGIFSLPAAHSDYCVVEFVLVCRQMFKYPKLYQKKLELWFA